MSSQINYHYDLSASEIFPRVAPSLSPNALQVACARTRPVLARRRGPLKKLPIAPAVIDPTYCATCVDGCDRSEKPPQPPQENSCQYPFGQVSDGWCSERDCHVLTSFADSWLASRLVRSRRAFNFCPQPSFVAVFLGTLGTLGTLHRKRCSHWKVLLQEAIIAEDLTPPHNIRLHMSSNHRGAVTFDLCGS